MTHKAHPRQSSCMDAGSINCCWAPLAKLNIALIIVNVARWRWRTGYVRFHSAWIMNGRVCISRNNCARSRSLANPRWWFWVLNASHHDIKVQRNEPLMYFPPYPFLISAKPPPKTPCTHINLDKPKMRVRSFECFQSSLNWTPALLWWL